jgi:hypothetical protein
VSCRVGFQKILGSKITYESQLSAQFYTAPTPLNSNFM